MYHPRVPRVGTVKYSSVARLLEININDLNRALKECGFDSILLTVSEYNYPHLLQSRLVCTCGMIALLSIILEEAAVLTEFVNLLELFAQATTQTQANDSPSISLVVPCLLSIYADLTDELSRRINLRHTSSIAEELISSLQGRFGGLFERFGVKRRSTYELYADPIFPMATFLDGKFKRHWLDSAQMNDAEKQVFVDGLKRYIREGALTIERRQEAKQQHNTDEPLISESMDQCHYAMASVTVGSPSPKRKSLFEYLSDEQNLRYTRVPITPSMKR